MRRLFNLTVCALCVSITMLLQAILTQSPHFWADSTAWPPMIRIEHKNQQAEAELCHSLLSILFSVVWQERDTMSQNISSAMRATSIYPLPPPIIYSKLCTDRICMKMITYLGQIPLWYVYQGEKSKKRIPVIFVRLGGGAKNFVGKEGKNACASYFGHILFISSWIKVVSKANVRST